VADRLVQDGRTPPIRNPWLCIIILSALSAVTILGVLGLILLAFYGRPAPESLVATVSTAIGSMASFLVMPPRGSVGTGSNNAIVHTERTVVSNPEAKPKE
jgi:hypothetical protein